MSIHKTITSGIKSWSSQDRPREKMISKGSSVLSDAELIAILLGSGSRNETAVDLSKRILSDFGNDLNQLSKLAIADFMKYKGIGEAKAVSICAALELGRRRKQGNPLKKKIISSSADAYNELKPYLADLKHEEFWIILLSKSNTIIQILQISKGGVSMTVVDPKMVFKPAIDKLASAIILVHNHPSGNLNPSKSDISLTTKLVNAADSLDIKILDHLIITDRGYYSFADEGVM